MTYQHIKCPDFIRKDPSTGEILEIMCKMCGTVIAAKVERIIRYETNRQGERVKVISQVFSRRANYVEMKIGFEGDDEYYHITHGCNKCLTTNMSPAILAELHQADQEESPDGYTKRERSRVPTEVLTLKLDGGGIT